MKRPQSRVECKSVKVKVWKGSAVDILEDETIREVACLAPCSVASPQQGRQYSSEITDSVSEIPA